MPRWRKRVRLSDRGRKSFLFAVAGKVGVARLTTVDMFKRENPDKAPSVAGNINGAAPMTGGGAEIVV